MASLYETLGTRVEAKTGPGTAITKTIETVDNDHVAAVLELTDAKPCDVPGTTITRKVETADNDVAALMLDMLEADPKPSPGTVLTATLEEIDPDRVGEFQSISGSDI
ncbi:MAG: hypothetical protein WAX12_15015 [Candidatus Microthrix subdominans]|jgi:hypothetical protein|uniref:hypothetical protein n=1 Tax=Candidatus Neomicrothrix sp. TaxID=2719034 RepID=UPI002597A970|nr:hypothetical protein [Candidatus Microthrix sp.]HMS47710.1 hypothetical protein [Candidatus Microthrix sp.]